MEGHFGRSDIVQALARRVRCHFLPHMCPPLFALTAHTHQMSTAKPVPCSLAARRLPDNFGIRSAEGYVVVAKALQCSCNSTNFLLLSMLQYPKMPINRFINKSAISWTTETVENFMPPPRASETYVTPATFVRYYKFASLQTSDHS